MSRSPEEIRQAQIRIHTARVEEVIDAATKLLEDPQYGLGLDKPYALVTLTWGDGPSTHVTIFRSYVQLLEDVATAFGQAGHNVRRGQNDKGQLDQIWIPIPGR